MQTSVMVQIFKKNNNNKSQIAIIHSSFHFLSAVALNRAADELQPISANFWPFNHKVHTVHSRHTSMGDSKPHVFGTTMTKKQTNKQTSTGRTQEGRG